MSIAPTAAPTDRTMAVRRKSAKTGKPGPGEPKPKLPSLSSLNYYQIATATGLSRPHVSRVLRGKSRVSLEVAAKIAAALGISTDDLYARLPPTQAPIRRAPKQQPPKQQRRNHNAPSHNAPSHVSHCTQILKNGRQCRRTDVSRDGTCAVHGGGLTEAEVEMILARYFAPVPDSERPTMRDLAEEFGVSRETVSNVLRKGVREQVGPVSENA